MCVSMISLELSTIVNLFSKSGIGDGDCVVAVCV